MTNPTPTAFRIYIYIYNKELYDEQIKSYQAKIELE